MAAAGALLGSRSDPGLSDRGRAQALSARDHLRGCAVLRALCSPLRRARETAALALPGHAIHVDERWRELDFGLLTGLTWEQAKARHGDAAVAWRRHAAAPPGGEVPALLQRRVVEAALEALTSVEEALDGDIVVVTHSTPIRALIGAARGWPLPADRRIRVGHAGVRVVPVGPRTLARWGALASSTSGRDGNHRQIQSPLAIG